MGGSISYITKALIVLVIGIAVFMGYIAFQDPNYKLSREISIDAPAEKIFPYLNNAKLFEAWSPWSKLDPKAKMTYSGSAEGVGSVTSWVDGEKLGTGSATIIESVPSKSVTTKLVFVKPFTMEQTAVISIEPKEGKSVVTWSVTGQNTFLCRVVCFFMSQEKMIGPIFDQGLSNLKNLTETAK